MAPFHTFSRLALFMQISIFLSFTFPAIAQPLSPASKLVIEPDTFGRTAFANDPTTSHRAGMVTMGCSTTAISVYAVLRDLNGTFIRFSDSSIWTSRDTSIVRVTGGNASVGEGKLTRNEVLGQTYIIAQDKSNPALKDSVLVQLAYCSIHAITFEIITSPEKRFAGDSISYRLQNRGINGLDTSMFCDNVMFQENIAPRPGQPEPFVIVNNTRMPFNTNTPVCSDSGQFLIKVVLYNVQDSLYKMDMNFSKLTQFQSTFTLFPAAVGRVEIQRRGDSTLVDSVFLSYPGGNIILASIGFDAFGNKRGFENANWFTTGTLHAITKPDSISRIYYEAANVISGEEGYIYCSPASDSTIRDSVKIRIEGPSGVLSKNRKSQMHNLKVMIQNSHAYVFPLHEDLAQSKLFFTLYSLSGRVVFKTEVADAGKPVGVNSPIQSGIYLVSLRNADRQLVKSRFVIVK
jgi:hypothetical protein